jgi:hypothetical protein
LSNMWSMWNFTAVILFMKITLSLSISLLLYLFFHIWNGWVWKTYFYSENDMNFWKRQKKNFLHLQHQQQQYEKQKNRSIKKNSNEPWEHKKSKKERRQPTDDGKREMSREMKNKFHSKKGNKSAVMNDRASHKFSACIHFSYCVYVVLDVLSCNLLLHVVITSLQRSTSAMLTVTKNMTFCILQSEFIAWNFTCTFLLTSVEH